MATIDGTVVGHILFSVLTATTDRGHDLRTLGLAPMGVLPGFQRQGIGARLVEEGLHAVKRLGFGLAVVLGHTTYYPRFGFSVELGRKIRCPYSGSHLMALELVPRVLAKAAWLDVSYPEAFSRA